MTIENITMPQLGESVTEGTITTWLVSVGDHVKKYDPIAEIMTDKVNAEVPSSYTGVIKEIITDEGATIAVGDLMCTIETEEKKEETDAQPTGTSAKKVAEDIQEDRSMKNRYSPAVLRLAQENNIDLQRVDGSGARGRITRKDIEKVIAKGQRTEPVRQQPAPAETTGQTEAPSKQPTASSLAGDVEIPVSGVRKAIAANMVRSKQEIPHAWMTVEVDVTDLVSYRTAIKDQFRQMEGYNLTYFSFFVKAVAQALKEYPALNSTWAGDKIIQRKDIHLSIAVAKDDQLFVPVIKHADEKTIKGIARDITDLAEKARNGTLTADDMQGGTFTVNNTGSFGSISSMGIINHPQAAILQVESIVKRPVIINDMFAARDMVNLSLSLDHRVLDGLVVGQFLARVKDILESMNKDTLSVY